MDRAHSTAAAAHLPGTVALIEQLVAINSHSRNRAGVNAVGRAISDRLARLGFHCLAVPDSDPERGDHLILKRPGSGAVSLALVSHLDTVYESAQEREHRFAWRVEGDWVFGPGVADIKGGTALIVMVLELVAELDRPLFEQIEWTVLLNAAEEEGNQTFPEIAREAIGNGTRACLVYEPGNLSSDPTSSCITRSRRGSGRFLIETFGREAHAGSGYTHGASAVREIARLIERIEALSEPDKGSTFNCGIVRGGVASNTVPGYAVCHVDTRAEFPADQERQSEQLLALAGAGSVLSRDDRFHCEVKVSRMSRYPPWPEGSASLGLAQLAERLSIELGAPVRSERRAGASDACHLWDVAPTLCSLGPIGRQIHCSVHAPERGLEQESMLLSSIVPRALLSLALIDRLARGAELGLNEK